MQRQTHGAVERAPSRYSQRFPETRAAVFFRNAAHVLLGEDVTGYRLAAALDNRASKAAAFDWLTGRRQPPQWAIDLLKNRVAEKAQRAAEIAASAPIRTDTARHHGAKLTALRRAKEKARREAGLVAGQTKSD